MSRSDAPGPDLSLERDQVIRTFTRGAQLTREFLEEYEGLQRHIQDLQAENGRLRPPSRRTTRSASSSGRSRPSRRRSASC